MSSLARQLLGATGALTTVTGSVFGSGSLAIPAGVVLVTLTGQGGTGGDNSYYNPGQPYVAPSIGSWSITKTTYGYISSNTGYADIQSWSPAGSPAYNGESYGSPFFAQPEGAGYRLYDFTAVGVGVATGQPYIAPTSGGGVFSGGNTTATLNSVTDTWTGGYGGAATSSVQTLASTGAGQTMTYSIASGGSLNYSYTY